MGGPASRAKALLRPERAWRALCEPRQCIASRRTLSSETCRWPRNPTAGPNAASAGGRSARVAVREDFGGQVSVRHAIVISHWTNTLRGRE
jgi:hypothetical protein